MYGTNYALRFWRGDRLGFKKVTNKLGRGSLLPVIDETKPLPDEWIWISWISFPNEWISFAVIPQNGQKVDKFLMYPCCKTKLKISQGDGPVKDSIIYTHFAPSLFNPSEAYMCTYYENFTEEGWPEIFRNDKLIKRSG